MHHVNIYLFLFITLAVGAIAQDNAEKLDLTLKNQKYQALPTEVWDVHRDQAKRLWYVLRSARPRKPSGVPECKAEIKAQFNKKQPVLRLARPVLFGPGNMIWFRPLRNPSCPGLTVIGYDGTTFVDYESTDETYIDGTPRSNLQTPTALFFSTSSRGMLVYHKKEFSYRYLGCRPSRLAYDPKNKQVLIPGMGHSGLDSLHLWKDGEWKELDLPKPEKGLRHAFFNQGSVQFLRENTTVELGKYICKSLEFLCCHENDTYLAAKDIIVDNRSLGFGVFIVKADGSYAALPLKIPPPRRTRLGLLGSPRIYDGKMWCHINGMTCVLDLKTGKIVGQHELPSSIQAVSGSRVYCGRFPVYVYQPDAPETRQALPVLKSLGKTKRGGRFSEDGIFYFPVNADKEGYEYIYRYYDGKKWQELPKLRFDSPGGGCLMGRNHTFLDYRYFYRSKERRKQQLRLTKYDKIIDSTVLSETVSVLKLIQRNRDMISNNISDARLVGTRIVTSGPKQIWVEGRELKVLSDDTWIDVDAELKKKGLKRHSFHRMVNSCMYIFAYSRGADRQPVKYTGFVASVDNGKLKLLPATFGNPCYDVNSHVPDSKALWLNVVDSSGPSCHGKPLAVRINSKGMQQIVKHKGHATVYDEIGNVWIGIRAARLEVDKGIYHIWRDGKIVSSIRVPGGNLYSTFFSDKPGSVYVSTHIGIHHYVANPKDPTTYSLDKTYYVPSIEAGVSGVRFSKRGFMVFGASYNPSIVALPKK